jgi:hypothetical protein
MGLGRTRGTFGRGSGRGGGVIQGRSWWFPRATTLHLIYEFAPPWGLRDV